MEKRFHHHHHHHPYTLRRVISITWSMWIEFAPSCYSMTNVNLLVCLFLSDMNVCTCNIIHHWQDLKNVRGRRSRANRSGTGHLSHRPIMLPHDNAPLHEPVRHVSAGHWSQKVSSILLLIENFK